ncbi:putative Atrial natriuretic peptide receptor 3 [Hypsibius exemplaris]|uniref:Atrial natriuretic peptide receptor 3 n=1 Tax=Hypsibius exemplaris TaxID=2072580 RepID=A0A1W0WFL7_HYPEX|nr:putative Atrial natriuretic peptide receptor 3 [Hypsibius exemplaris]
MERLRKLYAGVFNLSHTFLVEPGLTDCDQFRDEVSNTVGRYVNQRNGPPSLTAFLGTGCHEAVVTNDLAREWNYLMITSVAAERSTSDRVLSPTWISTTISSMENYLHLYLNLLREYRWTSIFIALDQNSLPLFPAVADTLYGALYASSHFSVTKWTFNSAKMVSEDYQAILEKFRRVSRICLFLGHGEPLRQLLIQAQVRNMTNGEFVYIGLEIFRDSSAFGSYSWKYGDDNDKVTRQAYRSLLMLGMLEEELTASLDVPVNTWPCLSRERYNLTDPYYHKVNPYLIGLYESFMIFGMVLNETLSSGLLRIDELSGKRLADRILNRTFVTDLGKLYIDGSGLRRVDLAVSDLNFATGEWEVVALQRGEGWDWRLLRTIDWGNGSPDPPPNRPFCGYLNDDPKCFTEGGVANTAMGIGIAVAIVLSVFACLVFRLVKKTVQTKTKMDIKTIAKCGWVSRQTSILKHWKKVWLVLNRNGALRYFKNEQSTEPKDVVFMPNTLEIRIGDPGKHVNPPEGLSKDFLFAVIPRHGSHWQFSAESLDDRVAWVAALQEARRIRTGLRRALSEAHLLTPLVIPETYPPPPPGTYVYIPEGYVGGRHQPQGYIYQTAPGKVAQVYYVDVPGCYYGGPDYALGALGGIAAGTLLGSVMLWPLFWHC